MRAAQKQIEFEKTEVFDFGNNKGFEKKVRIHKSEQILNLHDKVDSL